MRSSRRSVGHTARPSGANLRVTLHHSTFDDHEELVAEQWWTTVLLGTTAEPTGPALPDYSFSRSEEAALVAEDVVRIDEVMARRYAEVSGDFSEHHFSIEGARRSGQEAPFLHGLCTLALCTRAATKTVGGGDPRRIRRIAVRFAAPAFLGRDLVVQIFERADGAFALEATCGETTVIKNGFVELAASSGATGAPPDRGGASGGEHGTSHPESQLPQVCNALHSQALREPFRLTTQRDGRRPFPIPPRGAGRIASGRCLRARTAVNPTTGSAWPWPYPADNLTGRRSDSGATSTHRPRWPRQLLLVADQLR